MIGGLLGTQVCGKELIAGAKCEEIAIVYATNFFKPFFFEAVVAVNLTCMLVKECTKKLFKLSNAIF